MKTGHVRIALIYILVSLLWIASSNKVLFLFQTELSVAAFNAIVSTKAYVFVLITGILVYRMVKSNDERLRNSEGQYRTMYEDNYLPMWIYDVDTLRFVSVNEAAIRDYGYSRDEFLNMTILDIRPESHSQKVKVSVYTVSEKFKQSGTWIHRKADGSFIHVVISSHYIRFNEKPHVMVVARDITENITFKNKLEKLNHEIEQEKQKLSDTQMMAKVAGWELYVDNWELIWSSELYALTGISAYTGKNLFDMYAARIHAEDRPLVIDSLEQLVATGKQMDITHRINFPVYGERYVREVAKLEYRHERPYKVIGFMQDITELKQLETERDLYLVSLDDTLNNITESFYALDKDFVITKANVKFEVETGLSNNDVVGKPLDEVFPGIKNRFTYQELQKAMSEKTSVKFEAYSRNMHKWLSVSAYPTTLGLAVYFSDISAQKEKDLKLKEAIERYDLVSKATQDIIYDYDLQQNRLIYNNNPAAWNCYSDSQMEDRFKVWHSAIHPEDRLPYMESLQHAMDNGEAKWSFEYRINHGESGYKYVYDQGYFIYDEDKKPLRLIGAIKDVDDLKRSNEENRRLAEIVTKVNNIVFILDTKDKITWANKAFEDYLSITPADYLGRRPRDIIAIPESERPTQAYIAECKRQLRDFSVELQNLIDGQLHWVSAQFTPFLSDEGQYLGYIVVQQNITSRKLREKRIQLQNEAFQQIAWLSSHEVRRPVASILGLVQLCKETDNPEECAELLTMIERCGTELDLMVREMNKKIEKEMNTLELSL